MSGLLLSAIIHLSCGLLFLSAEVVAKSTTSHQSIIGAVVRGGTSGVASATVMVLGT